MKVKLFKNKLFKLIIVFLLFLFIELVEYIPILLFNIKDISGPTVVILDTFKNIILLFILFLIYRKDLIKDWDKFRSNAFDYIDVGLKHWFGGLLVMAASNLLINFFLKTGGPGNEEAVQKLITYLPWLMLIDAGFIAPITEEIVFRKSLRDYIGSSWKFIAISGFVFGLMHVVGSFESWVDLLYIIPYGALGYAYANAYDETDTIFTPITLHIIHNTILLIVSIISIGKFF